MQAAIDLAKELKAQKLKEGWLVQKYKYWRSCWYKSTNTGAAAGTIAQILTHLRSAQRIKHD